MRHNKMCPTRLRGEIVWLSALIGLFGASLCHAEDLNTSQKQLSESYRNYYQAVRKAPQPLTETQKAQALRTTVGPATENYGKAVREGRREGLRNAISKSTKPSGGNLVPKLKAAKSLGLVGKKTGGKGEATGRIEAVAPPKPDVVLDGSQVPREMEFSGKKTEAAPTKKSP